MQQVALWHVTPSGPERLRPASIELEAHLETWIEQDPSLLEEGLIIVGRQFQVEAGPLDLLALDVQGRWTVVEIKRGALRRDTVAQALDYASCLATLPFEQLVERADTYLATNGAHPEGVAGLLGARAGAQTDQVPREVAIYVVGAGRDAGLERIIDYLSGQYALPIRAITFGVFELASGERVLTREVAEAETGPTDASSSTSGARATVETALASADAAGIGRELRAIHEAAVRLGLYPRVYKASIMYAPTTRRTRCLFTVRTYPTREGRLYVYVAPEGIAEFFGRTRAEVTEALSGTEWLQLGPEHVAGFVAGLARLFGTE